MSTGRIARLSTPSDREVLIEVSFALPAPRIFRAFTEPDLVTRWWGRPGGELVTCEIDLRPGGAWRYVFQPMHGPQVSYHGEFTDVVRNVRVAYSDVLEDLGGITAQNSVTFVESGGTTELRVHATHLDTTGRDRQLATFDEDAMQEPFAILGRVAAAIDRPS